MKLYLPSLAFHHHFLVTYNLYVLAPGCKEHSVTPLRVCHAVPSPSHASQFRNHWIEPIILYILSWE